MPEPTAVEPSEISLPCSVRWARTRAERARGLLGTRSCDTALVLPGARQVHTFGMRYAIDVVFCDREFRVVHVVRAMRPWRVTRWVARARIAIELPAGAARSMRRGQRIALGRH